MLDDAARVVPSNPLLTLIPRDDSEAGPRPRQHVVEVATTTTTNSSTTSISHSEHAAELRRRHLLRHIHHHLVSAPSEKVPLNRLHRHVVVGEQGGDEWEVI